MNDADHPIRLRHRLFWVGTFGMTCLLLWLPFGFGLTAVLEEWGVLTMFTEHGTFFFAGADSPLATQRLRPLTVFPHALAYWLMPDSFDLWNVLLIVALMVKGMAAGMLGKYVTGSRRWGLVFGLLVLLDPADTMQLSFRALHINISLALVLLGSALLVQLDRDDSRTRQLAVGALASALLLASVLMYETAAALVLTPFLIWFVREGLHGMARRLRTLAVPVLAWVAGIAAFLAYVVVSSRSGETTYQQSLTTGHSLGSVLLASIPKLLDPGLVRSLLGGWVDAWQMAHREFAGYGALALAAAVLGFCVLASAPSDTRRQEGGSPAATRAGPLLRMVVAGIALAVMGYAPYAISPPHVAITQRTYLFTAPGAALVVLALLLAMRRFSRLLPVLLVALLLSLGVAAQWVQFRHYVTIAEQQRRVLRNIVENFDGELDGRTLIVKDLSGQLGHLWMLRDHLGMALTYLYGKPIGPIEICLAPSLEWQHLDDLGRSGRCVQHPDHWTFSMAPPVSGPGRPLRAPEPDTIVPADRAQVIEIESDGHIKHDPALDGYRARLAASDDAVDRRYRKILARHYAGLPDGLFKPVSPQVYRWNFGDWWNLDLPVRGSGWREAEWSGKLLKRHASAWKTENSASLIFDLQPAARPYRLTGRLETVIDQQIKDSVVLKINGHPLSITWREDTNFAAVVPPEYLVAGVNTLSIESATKPDYFGLSLSLQAVALMPG